MHNLKAKIGNSLNIITFLKNEVNQVFTLQKGIRPTKSNFIIIYRIKTT